MCLKVRTWWKPDIWLQELSSKFVGKLQRQQLRVQYACRVCPSCRKVKKGETSVQGALSTLCSSCLRDTQYKLRSYNLITWPECGPPLNFEQKEIVQQYFAMNRERGKLYLLLKLSKPATPSMRTLPSSFINASRGLSTYPEPNLPQRVGLISHCNDATYMHGDRLRS
jgi:hypothetical protein